MPWYSNDQFNTMKDAVSSWDVPTWEKQLSDSFYTKDNIDKKIADAQSRIRDSKYAPYLSAFKSATDTLRNNVAQHGFWNPADPTYDRFGDYTSPNYLNYSAQFMHNLPANSSADIMLNDPMNRALGVDWAVKDPTSWYNQSLLNKHGGLSDSAAMAIIGTGTALIGGGIGGQFLGPMLGTGAGVGAGAGAMSGATNALANDGNVLEGALKGGTIGGVMGGIGSAVSNGVNSLTSGYNPGVADSIWSDSATINPFVSTGMQMGSVPLQNLATKGITNTVGSAIFGGSSQPTTRNNSGGGMADNSTINIGGANIPLSSLFAPNNTLGSLISPALGAYSAGKQQDFLNNAFNNATNLITTPTTDQQNYRTKLNQLTSDPSSFYSSPVYKAMFDQGRHALESSQSAKGILGSGQAATELQDYGMSTAAPYYFNLANLYSGLSGIPQDTGVRATGAEAMMNGAALSSNLMGKQMGDLGTFGTNAANFLGSPDAQGNTGLSKLSELIKGGANTVKDWFGNTPGSSTPSPIDFSSISNMMPNWSSVSGSSPVTSWDQFMSTNPNQLGNLVNGVNTPGYTDWSSLLANPNTDYSNAMNWFA